MICAGVGYSPLPELGRITAPFGWQLFLGTGRRSGALAPYRKLADDPPP